MRSAAVTSSIACSCTTPSCGTTISAMNSVDTPRNFRAEVYGTTAKFRISPEKMLGCTR
jgi:hypothetical protein